MSDNLPEVFIFIWYPDGWLPRAVIIDHSKLDDESRRQVEILIKNGPILYATWKKVDNEENSNIRDGFINNKGDKIDNDLSIIVNTWQHYADNLHISAYYEKDKPDHWIHHAYEYYINDANSNLSPPQLYKKLSQMTSHKYMTDSNTLDGIYEFKVWNSVLVSDISIDVKKKINPLRFFYKSNMPISVVDLTFLFCKKFHVDTQDLMIANSEKDSVSGYGYFRPKTIDQWTELSNLSKIKIDDIDIVFE